jgi:hypothetical protein
MLTGWTCFFLFFPPWVVSHADDKRADGGRATETSNLDSLTAAVGAIRDFLPESSAKCAIQKLSELVGAKNYEDKEVGVANKGLDRHFQNFQWDNQCFSEIARKFWNQVNEADTYARMSDSGRPTLSERVDKGRFADKKPGWLWKKALEATNGNSTLAMTLVGMCTNDDIASEFTYYQPDSTTRSQAQTRLEEIQMEVNQERGRLKKLELVDPEFTILSQKIDLLLIEAKKIKEAMLFPNMPRVKTTWSCPGRTSGVFAQGSIDPSFELPRKLRADVIAAQGEPHRVKPTTLPSKSYHFSGGAITGCELVKCGIEPETAEKVAGLIAATYRATRLCPEIKRLQKKKIELEEQFSSKFNSPDFAKNAEKNLVDKERSYGMRDDSWEKAIILRLRNDIVQVDAATLYGEWYLGGKEGLPCTHLRFGGPKAMNRSYGTNGDRVSCGIDGWSDDRCRNARRKLLTWDVDFDWTKTQHEIGARFGAKNCKARQDHREVVDRVCADMKAKSLQDARPSSPVTTIQ